MMIRFESGSKHFIVTWTISVRGIKNRKTTLTAIGKSSMTGSLIYAGGRTGLMVRASDSGSGDPSSILGRVGVFVSLSKRHLLPKSTGNTQE